MNHAIQYTAFIATLLMELVKGCKAYHKRFLKNTSLSNEPSSTQCYLSSQRLTEVDATSHKCNWCYLEPYVINDKDVSKQEINLVSINILVTHECKNSFINGHTCLYTRMHTHTYTQIYAN